MRDAALLGVRLVLGSYLAAHGAQKLFGAFDGPGLDKAGAGFERIGLTPGRQMAAVAGATELAGGVLTATGIADPAGPLAIIGAMSVASVTHRARGPLAAKGGYELPLTNLATAAALVAAGPGRIRIGPRLPRPLAIAGAVAGAAMAGTSIYRLIAAGKAAKAAERPGPTATPSPAAPGKEPSAEQASY
jgi:putative oxidoreductase